MLGVGANYIKNIEIMEDISCFLASVASPGRLWLAHLAILVVILAVSCIFAPLPVSGCSTGLGAG